MAKKPAPDTTQAEQPVETPINPVMGRPTSYRPEYAQVAAAMCRMGATDVDLAEEFDVTTRTVNRWKVTYPEFMEAMKKGKEMADMRVEDSLYHRAMGTEYEKAHPIKVKDITYDDKGKKLREVERVEVVMVKEVIPADTTAITFWLKNRNAADWRDVQRHEHGKPGDFDNMSLDEINAFIANGLAELPEDQRKQFLQVADRRQSKAKGATKH